ncbi:MAG: hypothetical protein ACOCP6_00595, partial [Desulfosalsimonas sp.]
MTNPCENCDIEEKVHVCCGRHPETGKRTLLQARPGRVVYACGFLDDSGMCSIYTRRPEQCRRFFCERFSALNPFFSS